jgi:hypothetical protein
MPKRVVDGEGIWRSDKLARIEPLWRRAEYANLLPLALANGVFECEPRRVWSVVYSYNRPDITLKDVEEILTAFERVGMLFRWLDAGSGKAWGFWVGIDKKGRLPSPSRLDKRHEAIGPDPPKEQLKKYIETHESSQWPANGEPVARWASGFGFGSERNIRADKNRLHGSVNSSEPPIEADPRPSTELFSTAAPSETDEKETAIGRVWAYYLEKLDKEPKLMSWTPLRKQKGLARLADALRKTGGKLEKAEALMRVAVDNLAGSSFHRGANDRKKRYDSWEKNLFSSTEQFERWLEQE